MTFTWEEEVIPAARKVGGAEMQPPDWLQL